MGFGETLREFGVKVSLNFDTKKFEEAQNKVEKLGGKLRSFAFEISGLTAGMFEFQNLFTSNARSLQDQADLLGLNTTELQEYEYAAKVAANVNREDLVSSLQALGDTMDKARAGDLGARQALEEIGGRAGNTGLILGRLEDKTYKVTDAMKDMSTGIEAISKTSPQAASRLTEMTLGNSKLYNLLRQGPKVLDQLTAEGGKNFALNEKMIKQGFAMDVQMSKLWMTFRKFGYEIGYNVMKHLTPMINQFTKWFSLNKAVIASGINTFLDAMADGLQFVWRAALKVVEYVSPLVDHVGGLGNAVKILIGAFLAFKTMSIAASFLQLGIALAGAGIALAPILAVSVAIGAVVTGIHDLWTLLTGGNLADTWVGKLIDGFDKIMGIKSPIPELQEQQKNKTGAFQSVADFKAFNQSIAPTQAAQASGALGAGGPQTYNAEINNTYVMPADTTVAGGAAMISKATTDAHDKMLTKMKLDSSRNRQF